MIRKIYERMKNCEMIMYCFCTYSDALRRQLQADTPMPALRHKQFVSQRDFYATAPHTLPFIDASQIDPQFGYVPARGE